MIYLQYGAAMAALRKNDLKRLYLVAGEEKYLAEKELDLTATLDGEEAYKNADYVVIAAPTNYDSKKNFFDCSAVETVIEATNGTEEGFLYEASDLVYHLIVLLTSKG